MPEDLLLIMSEYSMALLSFTLTISPFLLPHLCYIYVSIAVAGTITSTGRRGNQRGEAGAPGRGRAT